MVLKRNRRGYAVVVKHVDLIMEKYDYLIIGGGIAGVTAAETIRGENSQASIAIISAEPYPLYSRVSLPRFLKKKISREQLFLRKSNDFSDKDIKLRLGEKVLFVDVGRKEVGLENGVALGYEKLLISSGGRATDWRKPENQEFIYHLQTLDDADRLYGALAEIKQPLVVGASFISLEFLEIFTVNKITPSVILRNNYFLEKTLGPIGGDILKSNLERYDIRIQFNDSIGEVQRESEGRVVVVTRALRRIECDALALGVGVDRNIEFLKGSGIRLGEKGILTSEFLESSEDGIFAAGDTAEFYDTILGAHHVVGNWTNAFLQGRRAGLNMSGQREPFKNVTGYSITSFGFQITVLGYCHNELESIVRSDLALNQYERFFLKDGVLVGASLINRFEDKPHLVGLIESKKNMEEYKEKMKDFSFDIRAI